MAKKYLEVTVEGRYKAIKGLIEGFLMGRELDEEYYFCKNAGIKSETLGEILVEFMTLHLSIHHLVITETLYKELSEEIKKKKDDKFVSIKYIKSVKPIKSGSFTFFAETFGRKYADEIKDTLESLSCDLNLEDYKETEEIDKDENGTKHMGLYAPDHEYTFHAKGKIESTNMKQLIECRDKLDFHPLVEVEDIILDLEKNIL